MFDKDHREDKNLSQMRQTILKLKICQHCSICNVIILDKCTYPKRKKLFLHIRVNINYLSYQVGKKL